MLNEEQFCKQPTALFSVTKNDICFFIDVVKAGEPDFERMAARVWHELGISPGSHGSFLEQHTVQAPM